MAEKPKPGKEKGGRAGGDEKVLIIPLRANARKSAKNKRMNRSVREIKAFVARHMRTELSNVQISQQLNESLWKKGLHNPPSRIKIKVSADTEGKVLASLMEEKERGKKESKRRIGLRQRLARRRETAKEEKEAEKPELKKEGGTARKKAAEPSSNGNPPSGEKSKPEKPAAPEPPKEKPKKEPAKEEAPEEIDQELMLEE